MVRIITVAFVCTFCSINGCDDRKSSSGTSEASTANKSTEKPDVESEKSASDELSALQDLRGRVTLAENRVDEATQRCLAQLKDRPDYRSAQKSLSDMSKELAKMRAAGTLDGRLELSSAFNKTKMRIQDMEVSARARDKDVIAESASLSVARESLKSYEGERDRKQQARDEETKRRWEAEKIRADNDPVNIAIRSRQIIRGMTIAQAMEAMAGCEPSFSDAGNFKVYSWRSGPEIWRATFVDGVAVEVGNFH